MEYLKIIAIIFQINRASIKNSIYHICSIFYLKIGLYDKNSKHYDRDMFINQAKLSKIKAFLKIMRFFLFFNGVGRPPFTLLCQSS